MVVPRYVPECINLHKHLLRVTVLLASIYPRLHHIVVEHGCSVILPHTQQQQQQQQPHSSSWYVLGQCLTGTIALGLSVAGALWCRTFAVELAHTVPVSPSGSIPQFETGIFLYRATEFLVTDNSMGLTIVPDPGGVE